jgi:hypothetical protein
VGADELLLWAARSCATTSADSPAPECCTPDDWADALRGAAWHRIEGVLDQAIGSDEAAGRVPQHVRATLRSARQRAAAHTLRLRAELPLLVDALDTAGVGALLLKGGALTLCDLDYGYRTPGVRAMKDLDVLVPRSRVSAAVSALHNIGYTSGPYAEQSGGEIHAEHHEDALLSRDGSVVVELHHHVAPDTGRFDIAPWWERAVHIAAYDCDVLAPTDQLTHLCLHFTYDRAHRTAGALMQLVDITRTLTLTHDIDWDAFEGRLSDQGLRASVAFALHSALHLLGARVPDGLLDRLTPPALAAVQLPELIDRRVLREQRLSTLHARNYVKPTGLARRLFPSASEVRLRYTGAANGAGFATVRAYARHYAYAFEVCTRPVRRPREVIDELHAERALDGLGR